MYCTACGTRNAAESNYCKSCGHPLEKTPQASREAAFESAMPPEERVQSILERAYRLRKEGDLAGAVLLCEQAIEIRSDSTSAHSLLGQLHQSRGDREAAIREYERVLELNPGSIADRVKLDEIRDNIPERLPGNTLPARIQLSSQPKTSSVGRYLLIGTAIIGLILIGAEGLTWVRSRESSRHTQNPNDPSKMLTQNTGPGFPQSRNGSESGVQTSNTAGVQSGVNNPGVSYFPPYLLTQPPAAEHSPTRTVYIDRGTSIGAGISGPKKNGAKLPPIKAPSSGGKIILPTDDPVGSDGKGHYYINLTKGQGDSGAGKGNSVHTSGSDGGGSSSASFVSGDTRSQIELGDDLKLKEQYSRAISAYRKALSGSGDETGFVCQKIAKCYEYLGNKSAAKSFYQKAVGEFQKLENAGRLGDAGHGAMSDCTQGIKICENG